MKDLIWFIRDTYSYRRAGEGIIKTTINLPYSFIAFMKWRGEIMYPIHSLNHLIIRKIRRETK